MYNNSTRYIRNILWYIILYIHIIANDENILYYNGK